MVSASLDMLEESLVKKIEILRDMQEENDKQRDALKNPETLELQAFDDAVEKKGEMIDQLLLMDEGFQSLFDKVKEEIGNNKDKYKDQIQRMKQHIEEITSLSASIEASERRNKKLAEEYFSYTRHQMNEGKQTSAAAFNYYRTMTNFKDIPPQFLDEKN